MAARENLLVRMGGPHVDQPPCAHRLPADHHRDLGLSAREIGVFQVLALHAGRVVSKEKLLDHLCGYGEEVFPNAVEVYVHRLRKKLESGQVTIRTIRGLGYLLEKPHDR